jgi:hypothetical protein
VTDDGGRDARLPVKNPEKSRPDPCIARIFV